MIHSFKRAVDWNKHSLVFRNRVHQKNMLKCWEKGVVNPEFLHLVKTLFKNEGLIYHQAREASKTHFYKMLIENFQAEEK